MLCCSRFKTANKKKEIKNQLLKNQKLTWLFSKNLLVDSDLLAAFRSGTEQEQGVLLIAGAGSITAGWNKGKEGMKPTAEGVAKYLAGNSEKL